MAEPKKKSALIMAFGPPDKDGEDGESKPEMDDGYDGEDDEKYEHACREFFMAAGIVPKDEKAACEALKAFVDMCMSDEDKDEDEEEGEEPEEPEAA